MTWESKFKDWLKKENPITTNESKAVNVFSFKHDITDKEIMSAWARHFREHYCLDSIIDDLRAGTGLSRAEYLTNIKFPDVLQTPGPSIRAGDFGEILIADYLQFILDYWVPRTRYSHKKIRNESTKGSDIIGFKLIDENESPEDILAIFEVKTKFSRSNRNRLNDAIDGSAKDRLRDAESLNAMKQRFLDKGWSKDAKKIEHFQNPSDKPYKKLYGAAVLFSTTTFEEQHIKDAVTAEHPHPDDLELMIIKGNDMMDLVHELYKRAANEA